MTDMMANLRAAGLREVIDYLERLKAILVGTDAGSLPNDYTLIQIAEARMADLSRRAPPDLEGVDQVVDINKVIEECAQIAYRGIDNHWNRIDVVTKIRALASLPNSPGGVGDGWCYDMERAPKDGMPLMLFARSKKATASVRLVGWYLEDLGWVEAAFSPNHPVGIIPQAWQHLPDFPNHSAPIAEGK